MKLRLRAFAGSADATADDSADAFADDSEDVPMDEMFKDTLRRGDEQPPTKRSGGLGKTTRRGTARMTSRDAAASETVRQASTTVRRVQMDEDAGWPSRPSGPSQLSRPYIAS